ncbi:MAG: HAD family phosphatase [Spirochaetaceae bacterium]|jgi:putative hydrolase of the HAD superfamily|nr:HAD family phosphatase [Spirochaetaceae bacterium]
MIKAVVFDYGKVISFPPEDTVIEELAAVAGMEPRVLDSLLWPYRNEYDRGTLTGKEYYRMLLAAGGVYPDEEALEKMVDIDLKSWTRINPGTVELMEAVKAAPALKLGILSNMPHEFLALARGTIPVFDLPDVGIFSCEVGAIKPEAAIYRRLLAALGCEPAELVFFDDMELNIDAARALGIRAFLWKDPQAARAELNRLKAPV